MAKDVKEVVEEKRSSLLDATRKVLLASIGAVALAQDEVEDFVNRLIERGEIAEKDGRKLVRDVMDKRKKQAKETEKDLEGRMEGMLERMGIPTKSDIDALGRKIAALSKKVDELKKA